ncbi:MAG: DUF3592 domain-containing protein [Henriciella sp.]
MIVKLVFRILGLAILGVGLVIAGFGVEKRMEYVALETHAERVPGVVVGHKRYDDPGGLMEKGGSSYAPIIEYETEYGEVRRHVSGSYGRRSDNPVGETVELLVAPCAGGEDCEVQVAGGLTAFFFKYGVVGFGGFVLLIGGLLVWKPPNPLEAADRDTSG